MFFYIYYGILGKKIKGGYFLGGNGRMVCVWIGTKKLLLKRGAFWGWATRESNPEPSEWSRKPVLCRKTSTPSSRTVRATFIAYGSPVATFLSASFCAIRYIRYAWDLIHLHSFPVYQVLPWSFEYYECSVTMHLAMFRWSLSSPITPVQT